MRREQVWRVVVAAGVLAAAGLVWWHLATRMYVFTGVVGPEAATPLAPAVRAKVEDFEEGDVHRLAVLVTDRDSGWLGLARGLRSHGVPFVLTTDPARALRHRVVLVYPIVSGKAMAPEALRGLARHVREGGTAIAIHLAGGGLEEIFGVGEPSEGRTRRALTWSKARGVPAEDSTRVSGTGDERMGTIGYAATTAEVLARFDDGTAAATCRRAGGRACLLGVDLGALAQRAMNGRGESIGRAYVNTFEPSLDTLFRWMRDIYLEDEPTPWRVATVPGDREIALAFTFDVDYGTSVDNSGAYAAALAQRGLRGTFFVQTKYMRDYNDAVFFDDAAVAQVRAIAEQGMEIASHTVSHAVLMRLFEIGTGEERYPAYRPFVLTRLRVRDATVMGEARVSRFLLERLVGTPVDSFRPGHLSYPQSLPQVLQATGYARSSSLTANMVSSHLPFQLAHDRGDLGLVPAHEFPVTIEDEHAPPLEERFAAANAVLESIARERGHVVVLVHPNVTEGKLRFVARLADAWKDRAWIDTLRALGTWWSERDQLQVDVVARDGALALEVLAPRGARGVAIHLPRSQPSKVILDLEPGGRATFPLQSRP